MLKNLLFFLHNSPDNCKNMDYQGPSTLTTALQQKEVENVWILSPFSRSSNKNIVAEGLNRFSPFDLAKVQGVTRKGAVRIRRLH